MIELRKIADLAQLAAILEVSSFKPGNVDPLHDFRDTKYEDFLSGSIAIRSAIEDSATLGFRAGIGEISLDDVKIGSNIKKAVYHVKKSHNGGNTHLGIAMLFVPISAGAGICIAENSNLKKSLRRNIINIIKNSTIDDSFDFYDAVRTANAGGLNDKLIEKNIPFCKLMKISAKKDRIAEELSDGMRIIFNFGLPSFYKKNFANPKNSKGIFVPNKKNFLSGNFCAQSAVKADSGKKSNSIRDSITETYLQILAKFPDTLIAKKVGMGKAKDISRNAGLVLKGERNIEDFDRELRSGKNELNPGTTADIVAASIFVWLIMKRL